ncbi:TetR/AcrR family transcriptional regulator [Curtobacterium sp. DN_7.5]|uniref:TetR/AcrR family transcriptional regulator n=1 Tax=Curtobacterium sp. DN_7.5 TaxID=3049047 RepID=UPI001F58B558|nr:TetR/AcrR family transcriptional regulator [Curtobacterium sp. DN_7.5]
MDEPTTSDTRSRILVAAATMLGENPMARLSVRAVAARAGVSTGSLRHFFPTQQELLDTVVAGLQTLEIPDDPIADISKSPAERLEACLQLLLASGGHGAAARQNWTALHDSYIAPPAPETSAAAFLSLERLGIRRLERWLGALQDEGVGTAGEVDACARFLHSVVNGLSVERALPGARTRLSFETSTLRLAVAAVLSKDHDAT